MASLFNLEDMHQKEVSLIGCNSWHGKECNLLNPKGVFFMKGHVTISNLKEVVLDNILGHDHVNLTILYYPKDISMVMTIWKWPLAQIIMEGFSLMEFLLSYDESYTFEVDVEGMIGLKKKKYGFSKRKQKEIMSITFVLRIEKVLNKKSCHGVEVAMCCSLSYYQHFPCQMIGILRHKFWNKSFEERFAHMLDIPKRLH